MALTRHLGVRVRFSNTRSGEMCVEWSCGCVGIGKTSWNELDYRGCAKHDAANRPEPFSADGLSAQDTHDDDLRIESLV